MHCRNITPAATFLIWSSTKTKSQSTCKKENWICRTLLLISLFRHVLEFHEQVKDKIEADSYIVDFAVIDEKTIKIVELNPYVSSP